MDRDAARTGWKNLFLRILLLSLTVFPVMALFTAAYGEEKTLEILTLNDALRIAADKNRDIQKAREYRNYVESIYVQERAAALPQLFISAHAANAEDGKLLQLIGQPAGLHDLSG